MSRARLAASAILLALLASPGHAAGTGSQSGQKDPPGLVHMSEQQQHTIGLKTAPARQEPIAEPLHLPGTITFDPGHVAILRPFGQARVVRLLVQPGDTVTAGQPVVQLEMPQLVQWEQDLAAARAGLQEAQASVAVARAAYQRALILSREGSMARAEADRRRLVLAQAEAAVQSNQAKVTLLQTQIARLDPDGGSGLATLAPPIAGIVVSTGVTPGEVIESSNGAATVADLHTVLTVAQIPEGEAAKVSVGDPAEVSLAGDRSRIWSGRVATLGAELNPQARTLPARIVIANPDLELRAGMYVDVQITHPLDRQSVVVPASALQLIGDKRVVFTPAEGDGFQSHEVQTGVQRQDEVEIRRGLAPGQQVVTTGSFELKALLQKAMLGGS